MYTGYRQRQNKASWKDERVRKSVVQQDMDAVRDILVDVVLLSIYKLYFKRVGWHLKKKWTQSQSSKKGNHAADACFFSFFFSLSLNFHIDHESSHLAKCKWIMSNILFVKFRKFFVVRIEIGPVIDEEMNCILRLPVGPVGRVV